MDYQGNSKKQKEEAKDNQDAPKKDLEKVVSGEVIQRPQSLGAKFKNVFFGGDISSARTYVISEVLLPAIRNLVVESISKGADRLIYGENAHRRRSPTGYTSRVQYNNPIYRAGGGPLPGRTGPPNQNPTERWMSGNKTFDDIIVGSKEDADMLVENLINVVDMYEVVSVAYHYELSGLPSSPIDNKWGWTNLASIDVRQVREGWRIGFPPLEAIS
jgi:hypothetical protein